MRSRRRALSQMWLNKDDYHLSHISALFQTQSLTWGQQVWSVEVIAARSVCICLCVGTSVVTVWLITLSRSWFDNGFIAMAEELSLVGRIQFHSIVFQGNIFQCHNHHCCRGLILLCYKFLHWVPRWCPWLTKRIIQLECQKLTLFMIIRGGFVSTWFE